MIFFNCSIEYLPTQAEAEAIILDASQSVERLGMLLLSLEERLIKAFTLSDEKSKTNIVLQIGEENAYLADTRTLCLTQGSLSLLKSMICNVSIDNAFKGYHLDLEIVSGGTSLDLSIVLS